MRHHLIPDVTSSSTSPHPRRHLVANLTSSPTSHHRRHHIMSSYLLFAKQPETHHITARHRTIIQTTATLSNANHSEQVKSPHSHRRPAPSPSLVALVTARSHDLRYLYLSSSNRLRARRPPFSYSRQFTVAHTPKVRTMPHSANLHRSPPPSYPPHIHDGDLVT